MQVIVDVREYSTETGMAIEWEAGAVIKIVLQGDSTLISANQAGLLTLARHCLTLAQPSVPEGNHWHIMAIDASPDKAIENFGMFDYDSHEITLEKLK